MPTANPTAPSPPAPLPTPGIDPPAAPNQTKVETRYPQMPSTPELPTLPVPGKQ
jgi:hypothetical protein